MEQKEIATNGNGIANVVIVPEAESNISGSSNVSAKQETDFYTNTGRQYDLQHNQQNLGLLGKFFGSNSAAPTNIAGLVVVASLILFAITLFVIIPDAGIVRAALLGSLSSALSYMFGASSRK